MDQNQEGELPMSLDMAAESLASRESKTIHNNVETVVHPNESNERILSTRYAWCKFNDSYVIEAAKLAAKSFRDNKLYCDIFKISNTDNKDETVFMEEQYSYTERCMQILCNAHFSLIYKNHPENLNGAIDKETGKLVCFFILESSEQAPYTLWQKIGCGFLTFAYHFGLTGFSRLIEKGKMVENQDLEIFGQRTRISLQRMVVDPSVQGKGIGSYFLGSKLNEVDRLRLPVILSTQKSVNVTFYEKLGFKVLKEGDYGLDGSAYRSWHMCREPRS